MNLDQLSTNQGKTYLAGAAIGSTVVGAMMRAGRDTGDLPDDADFKDRLMYIVSSGIKGKLIIAVALLLPILVKKLRPAWYPQAQALSLGLVVGIVVSQIRIGSVPTWISGLTISGILWTLNPKIPIMREVAAASSIPGTQLQYATYPNGQTAPSEMETAIVAARRKRQLQFS